MGQAKAIKIKSKYSDFQSAATKKALNGLLRDLEYEEIKQMRELGRLIKDVRHQSTNEGN